VRQLPPPRLQSYLKACPEALQTSAVFKTQLDVLGASQVEGTVPQ
jgi:hypothetical protein